MGRAWYNDNSAEACAVLRELIAEKLIPPGDVDDRSIKDVRSADLRGYTQCHFFAGFGIWPAALREAGWDDDRPVWTGSCPCQPFSPAGNGLGFDDPRHLWPDWVRLIGERRPDVLFGEQSAAAGLWLNLVCADLEGLGYAVGSPDLPAAGFAQGAHIRQRFDWVADRHNAERWSDMAARHFGDWPQTGRIEGDRQPGAGGAAGRLANMHGSERSACNPVARRAGEDGTRGAEPSCSSTFGGLGHHHHHHHQGLALGSLRPDEQGAIRIQGASPGATGSLRGCDWLLCHDGRIRPVEAGTFPLAATSPGRLGALRGYGNALDFAQTVSFVEAYMESAGLLDLVA